MLASFNETFLLQKIYELHGCFNELLLGLKKVQIEVKTFIKAENSCH